MTTDPTQARNDNTDETTEEDGQLANSGPVPVAPEDAADMGDGRKIDPDVD